MPPTWVEGDGYSYWVPAPLTPTTQPGEQAMTDEIDEWVTVPREPTQAMLEAAWAEDVSMSDAHTEHGVTLHVWDAMLAAAPKHGDNPERLIAALRTAEAALSDIGDADREAGDDLAWCEARAAEALPEVRAALDGKLIEYSFACYSCAHEWEGWVPEDECQKCGTTNNYSAANPGPAPDNTGIAPPQQAEPSAEIGEQGVLVGLLRECLGPLEVSAAVIESDDTDHMEDLIVRVETVLTAIDRRAARRAK